MANSDGDQGQKQKREVAFSALIFGLGTLVSRFAGFIRDALVVAIFGREITDSWYTAFKLPNMFRRLFGEGALSVSFIPVFVDTKDNGSEAELQRLINGVLTLLLLVVVFLITLGFVFMEPIIQFWVGGQSGFAAIPGKVEQTVAMARIAIFFLFFILMFAYFMAILNGLKKFGMTGLAPAFLNLALIGGALYAEFSGNINGLVLPIAALVGGALQAGVLIPSLRKQGYLPKPTKDILNPKVRSVLKALGPSLLGLGIVQLTGIVNFKFASLLEQGSITYLNIADRLLELPLSLIAVSLQTALLPTLTGFYSKGQTAQMAETANHYLRLNYYLALPCAAGLFFLGQPIIEVLFVWGKFSVEESQITASILRIYAFTLLTAAGIRIISQSFYAMKNTLLPAKIATFSFFIHIGLAYYMTEQFGLQGLAGASLCTALINFSLLTVMFKRSIGSLQSSVTLKRLGLFLLALIPLCFATQVFGVLSELVIGFSEGAESLGGRALKAISLFLTIGLCAVLYFVSLPFLKIPAFSLI